MEKILKQLVKLKNEYLQHIGNLEVRSPKLPANYQIEPINYCNLKCPTCSSLRLDGIKKRWMRTSEFIKIAEQLPAHSNIYLTNWGEPFLNPEIIFIIREGGKREFKLSIDSNFNFDSKLVPQIVESGLDNLSASIDGTSQETYEKFRQGGNFDLAWHNFSEIAKLKNKKGCSKPVLTWQFIVNRYNEHEIETARKMTSQLPGDIRINFIPMGLRQEKIEWDQYTNEKMEKMKKEYLPENKEYIMSFFIDLGHEAVINTTRCPRLWNNITISVNLDITPCCHTYKPEHSFGNLNKSNLLEIWVNQAYRTSRKFFLDPSYQGCQTVCSRCPNYIRIKENNLLVKHWNFIKHLNQIFVSKIKV